MPASPAAHGCTLFSAQCAEIVGNNRRACQVFTALCAVNKGANHRRPCGAANDVWTASGFGALTWRRRIRPDALAEDATAVGAAAHSVPKPFRANLWNCTLAL